jgi:hypothetical protein
MRPRPAPVVIGITLLLLLLLLLLVVPAGAAGGRVRIYDRTRLEQTITNPPAGRCVAVASQRVPRLVNQTGAQVEAHTTRNCRYSPARVVAPWGGAAVSGLRAIRARD